MEIELISRIKGLELNKEHIKFLISFNQEISPKTLMIFNEFGLDKKDIDFFTKNYRNLGIIFNLTKKDENTDDWTRFVNVIIPMKKPISRLDNMFISKDFSKALLVTNKRLLKVDVKRLNEKISKINRIISEYNELWEPKEISMLNRKSLFKSIIKVFKQ